MPTDPLSEGLLVTVSAPGPTSKHKTLQLYNPDLIVELKYTGTISFKWGFKWEECVFVFSPFKTPHIALVVYACDNIYIVTNLNGNARNAS